jgi:hypothetical protein
MGNLLAALGELWYAVNSATQHRAIGPAIIKDMLEMIQAHRQWEMITSADGRKPNNSESGSGDPPTGLNHDHILQELLTDAIVGYVLPQLEGLPEREVIATNIAQTSCIKQDEIVSAVRTSLDLPEFSLDNPSNTNSF